MFNKLIIIDRLVEEQEYLKKQLSDSKNEGQNRIILIDRLELVNKEIKRLKKTL